LQQLRRSDSVGANAEMEEASHFESYVQMLRLLRDPFVIASRSGRVLAANVAAAETLGTSLAALEGTLLSSHSPDPSGVDAMLGVRPFPLQARDGRRCVCDASPLPPDLLLLRLSGGPDAAPRARALFDALSKLRGITAGASNRQTLEELSLALLTEGMSTVGAITGGVFLIDETGTTLELQGSVGYSGDSADRFRLVPLAAPFPVTDAVKQARTVLIGTPEDYAARYPDFASTHANVAASAVACVPLGVEGRIIGALALGFPLPQTFDDEDREYLRAFAAQCARSLDRARRAEADRDAPALAERTASHLERLHAFTRTLAQAITPAQVTEAIVDMGMAAAGARAGGLWLRSAEDATVCLARAVGPAGPRVEQHASIPLDAPARLPISDVIRNGTPVWIESCRQAEETYPAMKSFSDGSE
jgi:hypothetical protein